MEEEWNDLQSEQMLEDLNIAIIDAHIDLADMIKHKSGKDVRGKGVPTIYFIYGDDMFEYSGPRKKDHIIKFVIENSRDALRGRHALRGGKRKSSRTRKKKRKYRRQTRMRKKRTRGCRRR